MDLSIITVNYNTTNHLKDCLESIFINIREISFEIIVIDNNSYEREIEKFPQIFPSINIIFRDVNDGFGAGCNFGSSISKGKYLLFVNPDVVFESNIFLEMFSFMEQNAEYGACSPVFVNFEGNLVYTYNKFPNVKWELFEFLGKGNEREEKLLLNNEKILNRSNEPLTVDWLTGACLMIRADIFKKLKGFDEDYFLYYEDTDLQYRIHELGYKIACLSNLILKHFVNSSVKSKDGENVYYFHLNRSKMIFFYKHSGFFKRNVIRMLMVSGIFLRMIALNFRKRYSDKRIQKMGQYKRMLKIYFSGYERLLKL